MASKFVIVPNGIPAGALRANLDRDRSAERSSSQSISFHRSSRRSDNSVSLVLDLGCDGVDLFQRLDIQSGGSTWLTFSPRFERNRNSNFNMLSFWMLWSDSVLPSSNCFPSKIGRFPCPGARFSRCRSCRSSAWYSESMWVGDNPIAVANHRQES